MEYSWIKKFGLLVWQNKTTFYNTSIVNMKNTNSKHNNQNIYKFCNPKHAIITPDATEM